jgi:hypothetical protein
MSPVRVAESRVCAKQEVDARIMMAANNTDRIKATSMGGKSTIFLMGTPTARALRAPVTNEMV